MKPADPSMWAPRAHRPIQENPAATAPWVCKYGLPMHLRVVNPRTTAALAFLVLAGAAGDLALAQRIPATVPPVVVRRVAQAIWPDQLFDSLGRPEARFTGSPFRPDYEDLIIEPKGMTVSRLPGVSFYYGHAYPSACSHCQMVVVAVAARGDSSVTLREVSEIGKLITWLDTPIAVHDSTAAKELLLQFLSATCLIGCDAQLLPPRKALSREDSAYIQSVGEGSRPWVRPRTYSHASPGQMEMEFLVINPGLMIWRIVVTQQHDGRYLSYQAVPSATMAIVP